MTFEKKPQISFDDLNLSPLVTDKLKEIGYKDPFPIQAQTIPYILEGRDVLGQAQTGTGKTAAFALPILSRINLKKKNPQVLVLAPTRELAIQISEAFKEFSAKIKGLNISPIYGGQEYGCQLRALRQGVHIVIGTPGRIMDHIKRGSLDISELKCLVLDEADEMLRMGFIDDVEWILDKTPEQRQVALFSATMPKEIKQIANKYLKNPKKITIKVKTTTADTIRQRFWMVAHRYKLDTLSRILEIEQTDGIIIFVRTRTATIEIAEKLESQGFSVAALNGDLQQRQREQTINKLKSGKIDILVATDVAARGLDVDRISHVINYDIPHNAESYVHRIGRTGRAGRTGDAILFVTSNERRMLSIIEQTTKHKIEKFEMPTIEKTNKIRINNFKQKITDIISNNNLNFFKKIIEECKIENNISELEIAAGLAKLFQGDTPLILQKPKPESTNYKNKKKPPVKNMGKNKSNKNYKKPNKSKPKFNHKHERAYA